VVLHQRGREGEVAFADEENARVWRERYDWLRLRRLVVLLLLLLCASDAGDIGMFAFLRVWCVVLSILGSWMFYMAFRAGHGICLILVQLWGQCGAIDYHSGLWAEIQSGI